MTFFGKGIVSFYVTPILFFSKNKTNLSQQWCEYKQLQIMDSNRMLIITVSHNVPNFISRTLELKKLTGVSESFVSWTLYPEY